jgi:hypothetical protein
MDTEIQHIFPTSTTSFLLRLTQRGVVLRHDRDDRSRIFRALAFVDGRGVGRQQRIEFAESVGDGAAVEFGNNLTVVSGGEGPGVSRISGPGSFGWPSSDFGAS